MPIFNSNTIEKLSYILIIGCLLIIGLKANAQFFIGERTELFLGINTISYEAENIILIDVNGNAKLKFSSTNPQTLYTRSNIAIQNIEVDNSIHFYFATSFNIVNDLTILNSVVDLRFPVSLFGTLTIDQRSKVNNAHLIIETNNFFKNPIGNHQQTSRVSHIIQPYKDQEDFLYPLSYAYHPKTHQLTDIILDLFEQSIPTPPPEFS
jgi:hypothetical protein